ncbi:hypothetical protein EMCRGX_G001073 [Ephydatia muelleri]
MDFLEKHHGITDLSKIVLQLEGVSIQLQHHAYSSNSSDKLANEVSVSLIETVKIPAYSEIQTMAYTSSTCKGVWLVEGSRPDIPIIVAGAVVTPSIGEPLGSIPVLMCNPLPTETVVHKGTRIARATRLQDESLLAPVTDAMSQEKKIPKVSESKSKLLWEMVQNCAADLSKEEKDMLYHVLMAYADVFAESNGELGRTNMVKQSVDTGNNPPIRQQFRRMPPFRREQARKLIEDMLKSEIVQPSSSPWASPVVIVTKKDGSLRFCVDYRKLNSITRKDAYPLPRIDDSLDALNGSKWFSTLDLICGYWQVEMDENDRQKTAFCMQEGLFEFKVMPFGLCNAPATFQRLMDLVLSGIQWKSCLVYIDDIVIVDACQYGIGAVLSQDHDGEKKVVAYGSRTISKAERKGCNHGNADALSRIGPDENEANITGGSSSKGMGFQHSGFRQELGMRRACASCSWRMKMWGLCSGQKIPPHRGRAPLQVISSGYPMQIVAVDIIGPITPGEAKKPYILVASDYFTRWAEAYAIPNQEAITVATTLIDEFFCRFSIPQQLHSDQGRQFESDVMKEAKLPVDQVYGSTPTEPKPQHEYARQLQKILQGAFQAARENMGTATMRMKEVYNLRVHGKQYEPGDLVWLHTPVVPRGKPRKLHCPWTGPFRVVKRLSAVTYRILDLRRIAVRRRKRMVVHFDRLKPCPSDIRLDLDDVDAKNPEAEGPTSTNQCHHRPEYTGTTLQFFDDSDDLEIAEQEIVQQPARGQRVLEVHDHEDVQAGVATPQDEQPAANQPLPRRYPQRISIRRIVIESDQEAGLFEEGSSVANDIIYFWIYVRMRVCAGSSWTVL